MAGTRTRLATTAAAVAPSNVASGGAETMAAMSSSPALDGENLGGREHLPGLVPPIQTGEAVGAEDEKQAVIRVRRVQRRERVGGEADAATIDLDRRDRQCVVAAGRQSQHLDAMTRRRGGTAELVRRDGRRHEEHPVESRLLATALRRDEVPHVHRVERAAKNADPHQCPGVPTLTCSNSLSWNASIRSSGSFSRAVPPGRNTTRGRG